MIERNYFQPYSTCAKPIEGFSEYPKKLRFWVVSTRILSLQDVRTDHRLDAGKCSKGLYVESTTVEYSRPISSKRPNGTMPEGPPST